MAIGPSDLPQVDLTTHYLLSKADEKGVRFQSVEKGFLGSIKVLLLTKLGGYDAKIDHVADVIFTKALPMVGTSDRKALAETLEKFEKHEARKLEPIQSQMDELQQSSNTLRRERAELIMLKPEQELGPMDIKTGKRKSIALSSPDKKTLVAERKRVNELNKQILEIEGEIKDLQKKSDQLGRYTKIFDPTINTIKSR
jgi:hypothetical protein